MYLFLKIERTGGRVFLVFLGFPSPRPYISRQYSSASTYLYIVTLEWNLKNSASGMATPRYILQVCQKLKWQTIFENEYLVK